MLRSCEELVLWYQVVLLSVATYYSTMVVARLVLGVPPAR